MQMTTTSHTILFWLIMVKVGLLVQKYNMVWPKSCEKSENSELFVVVDDDVIVLSEIV